VRVTFPIALALLATLSSIARADSGVELLRRGAGNVDTEGWTRAVSSEGGFAIDMPCKFSEMRMHSDKDSDSRQHFANRAIVLKCSGDNGSVMVFRAGYNTGAAGADHVFANSIFEAERAGIIDRSDYRGMQAYQTSTSSEGVCTRSLTVRIKDDFLSISLFEESANCENLRGVAERVFRSFELTAP
jgi:hypothetical protein